MTKWEELLAPLGIGRRIVAGDREAVVRTHCLYPSNEVVTVVVDGEGTGFVVRDEGGAFDEGLEVAGDTDEAMRYVRSTVVAQGLKVRDGIIFSPVVSSSEVPAAVILVANASKEVAHFLCDHYRPRRTRNFRAELARLLSVEFPGRVVTGLDLTGASNKMHRFTSVIRLPGDRQLIMDPVINEASSINARVVAHLDVRQAHHDNVVQRIVYDEREKWRAADLQLLSVGAPAVPFSQVKSAIDRLAA